MTALSSDLLITLNKTDWKNVSLLVICEIIGNLVNTLTGDGSILFVIVRICSNQFKCNYLKIKKTFLNFLLSF